jgi:NitT/TauT family transport system substrate-binding protein
VPTPSLFRRRAPRRRQRPALPALALVVATALIVSACSGGSSPSTSAATSPAASPAASAAPSGPPTPLTVGLGYIPSVQFAQFYLADQAGYYRDAGLAVTFQNRIDPDLVTLVGQGSIDIGLSDGTSVIPAVSQGIPIRYVATVYGRFPSIVYAKRASGIDTAADLKGKRLGIPGKYGSSWVMLQALLASADLTPDDLEIALYPDFGQGVALQQGAVDAATGFANNEPVQLELTGEQAVILRVDEVTPLPGPGLIAGTTTLSAKSAAISAFVAATLRAMTEIAADPQVGLDAAIAAVPELAEDRAKQLAILEATVAMWESPTATAGGLGAIDVDGWTKSIAFMTTLGLVASPVTADQLTSSAYLPR